MSKIYSHTCDKACELTTKIACEKPCIVRIQSDAKVELIENPIELKNSRLNKSNSKAPLSPVVAPVPQILAPKGPKNSCIAIPGFDNQDNSCYLDSVLFSLFAFDTEFIRKEILEVDQETLKKRIATLTSYSEKEQSSILAYVSGIQLLINKIYRKLKSLESEEHCSELRSALLKNPTILNPNDEDFFWSTGEQQDASEFLLCIFDTFFINTMQIETITNKINVLKKYKVENKVEVRKSSPILTINVKELKNGFMDHLNSLELTTLSKQEELLDERDALNPEVIKFKKIKIMYKIFNTIVASQNLNIDKINAYSTRISRLNSKYKTILERLNLSVKQFDRVDDLSENDLEQLLRTVIDDLTKSRLYTTTLIATLNKAYLDPSKGYYKTHELLLSNTRYYDALEKINIYKFKGPKYLVVNISRFNQDLTSKNRKKINFEEQLNIDGEELHLNNIVVHQGTSIRGGHYVSFFRCNGNWYLYNDIPKSTITKIGSFKDLKEYSMGDTTPATDGTLFFYNNSEPRI